MQENLPSSAHPRGLLRPWRPDTLPDSGDAPPRLTRGRLEYELETLGNRRLEQEFEQLGRWLAQLELCPDLRPVVGSADGRSYWSGTTTSATPESWTFAFSTNADWSGTARSDCSSVASLGTDCDKLFIITSRSAAEEERADLERELSAENGLQIEILDRTWFVERLFSGDLHRQVAEMLGIDALAAREQSDASNQERSDELAELLQLLSSPEEVYGGNSCALALDYLRAARIARALRRPRAVVEDLLLKAEEWADRSSDASLRIRALHDHACTVLFWYDDPAQMLGLYLEVERLLTQATQPHDLELAHSLLLTLYSAVAEGTLSDNDVDLAERESVLRDALMAMVSDETSPSAAAYASLILATGFSPTWIADEEEADSRLELANVLLRAARAHPEIPVLSFVELLQEIEPVLVRLPVYEDLRETMQSIARDRLGDAAEAELLVRSAGNQVVAGEPLAALDTLEKATALLPEEDSIGLALRASLTAADAYLDLGLFWAARREALYVASRAMRTMELAHELSPEATFALRRMSDCELRLGRIRAFLAWHSALGLVADGITAMYYDTDRLSECRSLQDDMFSVFLMNLDERTINSLAPLEPTFEEARLRWSRRALFCRTGRSDQVLDEIPPDIAEDMDGLDEWMAQVGAQPARDQMAPLLQHVDGETWVFASELLGVRFAILCPDVWPLQSIADDLLGVLEVAFSTADWTALAILVDHVTIELSTGPDGQNPPRLDLSEPTLGTRYELVFGPDVGDWVASPAAHAPMSEFLEGFLFRLLSDITIDPLGDLRSEIDRWHAHERFARALADPPTATQVTGVLGDDPYALT